MDIIFPGQNLLPPSSFSLLAQIFHGVLEQAFARWLDGREANSPTHEKGMGREFRDLATKLTASKDTGKTC